jgi:hypothetical protein
VKLCDDAFPELGVSRRIRDVNALEHDACGMKPLAVAGDAVLVEGCANVDLPSDLLTLGLGRPFDSLSVALDRGGLDAGPRDSHPAANDEREDRKTAFHGMCARCAA